MIKIEQQQQNNGRIIISSLQCITSNLGKAFMIGISEYLNPYRLQNINKNT